MFLPRIIPVLLLKGKGLVKTVKFKDPKYIGDPINAVRIFNELKADELIFLDITASIEKRSISLEIVENISEEAYMPFAVGGGISNLQTVERLLNLGSEKVIINSAFFKNDKLISDIVNVFGSQSIVLSIDVKKNFWGGYEIYTHSATIKQGYRLLDIVSKANDLGVGEIIINSIDNDGLMKGFDLELISAVSQKANCPTVACGGAGSYEDLVFAIRNGGAHSVAAGSIFVFHGPRKAVLINYPTKDELEKLFDLKEKKIGI